LIIFPAVGWTSDSAVHRMPRRLSEHTLALDVASGAFAILDVQGFPLLRHWYAVYPTGKQLSTVSRTYLEHLTAAGAARAAT